MSLWARVCVCALSNLHACRNPAHRTYSDHKTESEEMEGSGAVGPLTPPLNTDESARTEPKAERRPMERFLSPLLAQTETNKVSVRMKFSLFHPSRSTKAL